MLLIKIGNNQNFQNMGLANNIITHPKDIVEKHTIAREYFAKINKVSKIVYLR